MAVVSSAKSAGEHSGTSQVEGDGLAGSSELELQAEMVSNPTRNKKLVFL